MALEAVHAVWDYDDGIRSGVTDFRSKAHFFEQEWSEEQQTYLPTFRLKPLSEQLLAMSLQNWQTFRAWEAVR